MVVTTPTSLQRLPSPLAPSISSFVALHCAQANTVVIKAWSGLNPLPQHKQRPRPFCTGHLLVQQRELEVPPRGWACGEVPPTSLQRPRPSLGFFSSKAAIRWWNWGRGLAWAWAGRDVAGRPAAREAGRRGGGGPLGPGQPAAAAVRALQAARGASS